MISDEDIPEFKFVKPPKRERSLEKKIVSFAESTSWEAYKTKCENRVGFPDRMFVREGRIVFMEVKKEVNGRISPKQEEQIEILVEQGMEAYFVSDLDTAKAILAYGGQVR